MSKKFMQIVLWTFIVLLLISGGFAIWWALQPKTIVAPSPPENISTPADSEVQGPVDSEKMSPEKMKPSHYFIPALDVYSQILPSDGFEASRYSGFDSLIVPDDATQTVWYSPGGALSENTTETEGTTLLASHVSDWDGWGALRYLYTLQGGEIVYVKDAEGDLSAWKVTELYTLPHTEFPEKYWANDGDRQLVITTCSDFDPNVGEYMNNIFAVATPVDAETLKPF